MHILFLSQHFVPEDNAPAARVHALAREWARLGRRVTVMTCVPKEPGGVVQEGYANRLYQEEWIDGIRTVRVWTYLAADRGPVRRGLGHLSYLAAAGAAGSVLRPRADVVVATSPQFFAGWAGVPVSRAHGAPFVLEIRDIWSDSITAVGALREGRIIRALGRLERELYEAADHIVAVGQGCKDDIVAKDVPAGKVDVVTDGVDVDLLEPSGGGALAEAAVALADSGPEERRRLGENGRRYVLEPLDRCQLARDYLAILERVRVRYARRAP